MGQLTRQGQALDILFVDHFHRVEDYERGEQNRKTEYSGVVVLFLIEGAETFAVDQDDVEVAFFDVDRLSPKPNSLCTALCFG